MDSDLPLEYTIPGFEDEESTEEEAEFLLDDLNEVKFCGSVALPEINKSFKKIKGNLWESKPRTIYDDHKAGPTSVRCLLWECFCFSSR